MLGQRQTDFLIGEEPLDDDVGFFAASADADPPAAPDTIAETTPDPLAGTLPAGRRPGRGSPMALWKPPVSTRQLAVGLLVVSGAAFAAIVGLFAPITSREKLQPPDATDNPALADRASARSEQSRRGRSHVADAGGPAAGAPTPARGRSRKWSLAHRHALPEIPVAQAEPASRELSPAAAEPASVGAQATPAGGPRSEFDFER